MNHNSYSQHNNSYAHRRLIEITLLSIEKNVIEINHVFFFCKIVFYFHIFYTVTISEKTTLFSNSKAYI